MIKQRSEKWFEQRKGKITGSRVGAILGLNPWMTANDVLRAMVREYHGAKSEFKGNIATEYGIANENAATLDFELETGLDVTETGFHPHPFYPFLGASPDGLIGELACFECKCPYGAKKTGEFKTLKEQPHYYAQVQIEMACTATNLCHFYQWSPLGSVAEIVEYDQPWFESNLPKLKSFYARYEKAIKDPDKYLADEITTKEAISAAAKYSLAKANEEAAKKDKEAAKKELIKIAGETKSNVGGLLVYPIEKAGSISYSKVVKELLPDADLSKYRGKSSKIWGIK